MNITGEGHVSCPRAPCREREGQITALLHGELEGPARDELEYHIASCGGCSSYLELQQLIGAGLRAYLAGGQAASPSSMPLEVQKELSTARRKGLAVWLQELGRALLFQSNDAVNRIHPGSEVLPVQRCLRRTAALCRSALDDPLIVTAGLEEPLVRDCLAFISELRSNPPEHRAPHRVKEALDRSLAILPGHLPTIKLLGHYYYLRGEFTACRSEYARALTLAKNRTDRWIYTILMSIAEGCSGEFTSALALLDDAKALHDSFQIDFHAFVNHLGAGELEKAAQSLARFRRRIVLHPERFSGFDYTALEPMIGYIRGNEARLVATFADDVPSCELLTALGSRHDLR